MWKYFAADKGRYESAHSGRARTLFDIEKAVKSGDQGGYPCEGAYCD